MLTTEPAPEVPVSLVTTRRYAEDKPCHVVLKPTPQRSHGGVRGPPDGRPRVNATFSSAGTGAFTAYVSTSRQQRDAASPQPTTSWTHVGVDRPRGQELRRPPYLAPEHFPRSHYLPRAIHRASPRPEHGDSDGNIDCEGQDKYPIDLRNKSKRIESDVHADTLDHLPKHSPTHNSLAAVRNHESEAFPKPSRLITQREENVRNSYSSLADITTVDNHESMSPGVGATSHYRHESVIMRNSFCQNSRNESPEGPEYKRYTFRNNTARAEVFEMKRNYAPVNDVLSHLAGGEDNDAEDQHARGAATTPEESLAAQSCSYDSDEEIDVVSDDCLQAGGGPTDEDELYLDDEESADSCEPQALDYSGSRRGSSPSPGVTSPSSGSTCSPSSSSEAARGSYGPDPQDREAAWGVFTVEDLLLRNRVLVMLWSLLGEERLLDVGYPHAPVHRVLWLTVDVCCSVAGMKSAAAVPLSSDHDCQEDMLCFRDHTHRFLEVCAPTRDMWKQFGWAGLTVDAVVRKIYEEELRPRLTKLPSDKLPSVVQRALLRLDRLEEMFEQPDGGDVKVSLPPISSSSSDKLPSVSERSTRADNQQPSSAKKKRGRPAKANHKSDPGRIERVMLWRFLLNLLEDPRNKPCIHWVQRDEGIFRILNTDWLARLWGRRHGNPRMTYEKMARAMRTYYRSKVLQPVPRTRNLPRKLIYKFNPAVIHKVSSTKYAPFSDRGLNYNTTPGS